MAVILAAGLGSRMRNIIHDKPKGFLQFGSKPIIEESIESLISCGIEEIIIVTGYQSQFYERLTRDHSCLKTVKNRHYASSGSMYSLSCAKDLIKEDFLLVESDIIYERKAAKSIVSTQYENCILISGKTRAGDEVFVASIKGRITDLSKDSKRQDHSSGELVGLSKISKPFFSKMVSMSELLFKSNRDIDYEKCISSLAKKEAIYSYKIDDLLWAEVDNESHFRRAEQIYPKILEKDHRNPNSESKMFFRSQF